MLSRALQKANTAVLLDNAQNFEGAMEAYGDACRLLQQVMLRSSGEDDRKKLEAIVSAPRPAVRLPGWLLTFVTARDLYQPHTRTEDARPCMAVVRRQSVAFAAHERPIARGYPIFHRQCGGR